MEICLSKYEWYIRDNVWVTGFIRRGEFYLSGNELLDCFQDIDSERKFEHALKSVNGQFSVIIKAKDAIFAATDRLRNFPLFYSRINNLPVICDDCYKLAESFPVQSLNMNAFNCFLSSGFVVNNLTLLKDIFQVEAGEYVVLGSNFSRKFYYDQNNVSIIEKDFKTASDELLGIISETLFSHFNALKNDFLAVSLSGGFDSRLIAAMCAKYHPENILCYTYGVKGNNEEILAGEVAKRLGFKWIKIDYDAELIEGYLSGDEFNRYFPYASDLSSMFFMEQYFAVKYLKENNLIPDNCIFITGFSGDMLAGSHLVPQLKGKLNKEQIAGLINKEFCVLTKMKESKKHDLLDLINEKIPDTSFNAWSVFENWDQKERQAKFIVNSARVFLFFGYKYVLPLWDNNLIDFFSGLPFRFKEDKKLYNHVLKEYIFKDRNLNFRGELNPAPSQKRFQRVKERIKQYLPDEIKNLFIKRQSLIFYDKITEVMIKDLGNKLIADPAQSNYYNSYIVQWYLIKTLAQFTNTKADI
jgi:asparagine synthase (glutamine-hydrolysing)